LKFTCKVVKREREREHVLSASLSKK